MNVMAKDNASINILSHSIPYPLSFGFSQGHEYSKEIPG